MMQPNATRDDSEFDSAESPANDSESNRIKPSEFERMVGVKEERKLKSRREGAQSPWFGLGMFGLVGWSVVMPTLLGITAGVWIDNRWPSQVSWTVTLLFAGLFVGCTNAWYWIQKESSE